MGGFGGFVRARRNELGLTQEEVAAAAGMSVRALRDIEKGRVARPRGRSLRLLARALGVAGFPEGAAPPAWEVGVLGGLVVRRAGIDVPMPQAKLRALIGLLGLHGGRVVTVEEIVSVLWPVDRPGAARSLVRTYVTRVRRLLSADGAESVTTDRAGYRLSVDAGVVDVAVFEACEEPRAALALWRGAVAADVPELRGLPAVAALDRAWKATVLSACVAARGDGGAAGRGGAAGLVKGVSELAAAEPFDEAVQAELMLTLAAAGRRVEALRVYAAVRARMADELGMEPGAGLREAHLAVLRGGSGPLPPPAANGRAPRPAQLPADIGGFRGRAAQLSQLDVTFDEAALVVLAVVTGAPGVGKTALAVRWSHRNRERFPDGQVYVDLGARSGEGSLTAGQALAQVLPALGVDPAEVPSDVPRATALYRSLLADRAVLVVLDNAVSAEQVRPLLPGGKRCRTVVTSRDSLSGLVAIDGARRLVLDVLGPADARALVAAVLGEPRLAREPAAATRLMELCGGLPLALRIAAALLVEDHALPVAELAKRLAAERLSTLAVAADDQAVVRGAFDLSYRRLREDERRAFCLLGVLPGPAVGLAPLAVAAGQDAHRTAEALGGLAAAHLVTADGHGRFALHDLLRAYALERSARDLGEGAVRAARLRYSQWYLAAARAATDLAYPQFGKLSVPDGLPEPAPLTGPDAAWAWLAEESGAVVAVIESAGEWGLPSATWLLADALHGYLGARMPAGTWDTVLRAALRAAERHGDESARAALWRGQGTLLLKLGEYDRALGCYDRARVALLALGRTEEVIPLLTDTGVVRAEQGRLAEAETALSAALDLCGPLTPATRVAVLLGNLATLLGGGNLARMAEAVKHATRAVRICRDIGDRRGELLASAALVAAKADTGRSDTAAVRRMSALLRGLPGSEGDDAVLNAHATALLVSGDPAAALESAEAAVTAAAASGSLSSEIVAGNTLAHVRAALGDRERAEALFADRLRRADDLGLPGEVVIAAMGLARLAVDDRPEHARALAERALRAAEERGMRAWVARAHLLLAHVAAHRSDRAAEHHARTAAALFSACGIPGGVRAARNLIN